MVEVSGSANMHYRTLGRTGLRISEIGYGTWQIANDPGLWTGADPAESLRCLHRYAELGGNFIDTAWIYGYSDATPDRHPSEELIGRFLKESGNREAMVIASKVPPKNMKWPAWQGIDIEEVFPADHIRRCVDDSLRSLGTDVIDLMQFHVWQDEFTTHDTWQTVAAELTAAGKVRHWGISVNDYQPANCARALATGQIAVIQAIFNLFHQRPIERLFPLLREHQAGLIVRVPFDEGGLTGRLSAATTFVPGDFRSQYFTPERLAELDQRLAALAPELRGRTIAELNLRFILSFPEVSAVIPGMRQMKNVELNTSWSDGELLSSDEIARLRSHAWERNFYPDVDPALATTGYLEP